MRDFKAFFLAVLLAVAAGEPGRAQITIPPAADPGVIDRRFDEVPVPKSIGPAPAIKRDDLSQPPAGADTITFTLKTVNFTGNKAISDAELHDVAAAWVGVEIQLSDLWAIRDAVTAHYRRQGYVLSRAIVPQQEITGGTAEFAIVEGYIDRVLIDGDITGSEYWFEHLKEQITSNRPITSAVLERYMLLLNDLSGIAVRSILRPSPFVNGASELYLIWEETGTTSAVSIDNFGTKEIGPWQTSGAVVFSNVYGQYESTEFRITVTSEIEELQYGSLTHNLPVGPEGTVISTSLALTNSQAGGAISDLNLEGESFSGSIFVTHPFIRSRSQNLSFAGGFMLRNSSTDQADNLVLSRDRTRSVSLQLSYDNVDQYFGVNFLGLGVTQGIDGLGARGSGNLAPATSRSDAEPDFTKFNLTLSREQLLTKGISLAGSMQAQYALDPLFSSEEIGFGGSNIGRGLDPFAIAGDSGAMGRLQLQFSAAPERWLVQTYKAFFFYDQGWVWRKNPGTQMRRESASTAGIGTEFNLDYDLFGTLFAGVPIDNTSGNDRDVGVFLRLSKRF